MSGMMGASMLRTRRRDVNLKPNRRLDRKSSRGMLYENEELRLRTININAEVERGQSDIKKLKRENEQLKREISALRYEYDRLDTMLRERRYSPEHSDDSASVCSMCPECVTDAGSAHVAFNDLSVVPEEDAADIRSGAETPCTCEECSTAQPGTSSRTPDTIVAPNNGDHTTKNGTPNKVDNAPERSVDVLVHDAPRFFESVTTPPYHVTHVTAASSPPPAPPPPPPPGFVISPYQVPRFQTGGNVEDLLGDVHATTVHTTTFVQQNSVFMCNTKKITQYQCCCCKNNQGVEAERPMPAPAPSKSYVTEKNIELTYDYPRSIPVATTPSTDEQPTTTTEVASTVVFVERRIPARPKKFDFFFRSRSAPVGENEEPIYATVNKLPKRLRRMELANLEKEVAYKAPEADSSTRTEATLKTDSESQVAPLDDDTSPSEREKSVVPQRPDTAKTKKRKRFSLTFKKRERKRREKKKEVPKNGALKNGVPPPLVAESDSERLLEPAAVKQRLCSRHRPRTTVSSSSSGPRYKRDSYQEMTTSHSEAERTNSACSSSLGSACSHTKRRLSSAPRDGNIPWCGCWGAGCL